jgi:glycosyltransferase 2 family protein
MIKILVVVVKTVVAVIILFYLFKSTKITSEHLSQVFKPANIIYFAISGSAFVTAQWLAALRLRLLLRGINVYLTVGRSFQLTMIGNFFNMVSPGTTGGDIIKGYYIIKTEEDKGKSSGVIVIDRIVGMLSLLFLSFLFTGYLLFFQNSLSAINRKSASVVVTSIFLILIIILCLFFLITKNAVRNRLRHHLSAMLDGNFFYRIAQGFGETLQYRRMLLYALSMSLLMQLLSLAGLLVFGAMMTEKLPDLLTQCAVSSLASLAGSIPVTPGNIGWTELVASFGWSIAGSSAGGAIFLYRRITNMVCSLPGGLFYISLPRKGQYRKNSLGSV